MAKFPFKTPERLTLGYMQSEVAGVLDRLWHHGLNTGPLDGQDCAPPVELREEPGRYIVTVELPGVSKSALEVSVSLASLTICGEKLSASLPGPEAESLPKAELAPCESCQVMQTERRYGSFKRTLALPGAIQADKVSASLSDGVLEVVLPKAAESAPTSIRVAVRSAGESDVPVNSEPT